MTKPARLAWAATVLSLAAAILPEVPHITRTRYDASLAVLTLTLISVVWYTYFAYQVVAYQRQRVAEERELAQKTIGESLIAELRWLEDVLYQIYCHGPDIGYDMLGHPVLDATITRSDLFSPRVAGSAASFRILVDDVRNGINEYSVRPERFLGEDERSRSTNREKFSNFVKAKAAFAISAIPSLTDDLVENGIAITYRAPEPPLTAGALPVLPQSPFGERITHESL